MCVSLKNKFVLRQKAPIPGGDGGNEVMTNKENRINIILLPKPVGKDPAPQSVSRRRSWKRPSYPVLEVRQISVTSISTSESVCGLYVAHPSCRSDAV